MQSRLRFLDLAPRRCVRRVPSLPAAALELPHIGPLLIADSIIVLSPRLLCPADHPDRRRLLPRRRRPLQHPHAAGRGASGKRLPGGAAQRHGTQAPRKAGVRGSGRRVRAGAAVMYLVLYQIPGIHRCVTRMMTIAVLKW